MTVTPCQRIAANNHSEQFNAVEMTPAALFDKRYSHLNLSEAFSNGYHPMYIAALRGNIALMRHFYEKDKSVLNLGDSNGWTPLMVAIFENKFKTARVLLEMDADPNIASTHEYSCWDVASIPEGAPVLGLSLNSPTVPEGTTCLGLAIREEKDVNMLKLLLKYKAIPAPALDTRGKEILDDAEKALAAERAELTSSIDSALPNVFPTSLLQMIAEFV